MNICKKTVVTLQCVSDSMIFIELLVVISQQKKTGKENTNKTIVVVSTVKFSSTSSLYPWKLKICFYFREQCMKYDRETYVNS